MKIDKRSRFAYLLAVNLYTLVAAVSSGASKFRWIRCGVCVCGCLQKSFQQGKSKASKNESLNLLVERCTYPSSQDTLPDLSSAYMMDGA